MKVKISPGHKTRLEKLCPSSKGGAPGRKLVAKVEDGEVLELEPGGYDLIPRYGGSSFARFTVSYLGRLEGWFCEPCPGCVEEIL